MSTNEELVLRAEQAAAQVASDKAEIQAMVTKLEEVQAPSIAASKEDIKQALIEKGQTVDDTVPFSEYGNKVRAIQTGGGGAEEDTDTPLILMHFDNNLDIQGRYSDSSATARRYMAMYMDDSPYTPTYADGVFGGKCLYIEPPTEQEQEYGEIYNKYITLPITNYFIDNDYTIDFWFKLVEGNALCVWFTDELNALINIGSTNVSIWLRDGYNYAVENTSHTTTIDEWHHFAFVKKEATHKVYADGVCKHELSPWNIKHQKLRPSLMICDRNTQYAGYIDEFRITPKALWETDFTPPTAEDRRYDKQQKLLVDIPLTENLTTYPLTLANPDNMTIGERGGKPCGIFTNGEDRPYLYSDSYQLPGRHTTSFWVYFDVQGVSYPQLIKFGYNNPHMRLYTTTDSYIKAEIEIRPGSEWANIDNTTEQIRYEAWNHVCVTYNSNLTDNTTITLYLNGVSCGSVTCGYGNPKGVVIADKSFEGGLCNIRVVDKVKTAEEVLAEYNAGV